MTGEPEERVRAYRALAARLRAHAVRMTNRGRSGHVGSSLSMAEIIAVLYAGVLRVDPANPAWPERDRFLLSKGHAAAALYAALAERGFFPAAWLDTYYQDDGKLMGHVSHHVPGVEFSTGSLGHGLPVAVGMALAAHRRGGAHRVFCLLSDGDCNEGSTWEAVMFAAQHRLDRLVAILDYNRMQALGRAEAILDLRPLGRKLEAFGWAVREVDGHDPAAIEGALTALPLTPGRPSWIIAHTVKGKGVAFLEDTVACHYRYVPDDQLAQVYRALGVTP